MLNSQQFDKGQTEIFQKHGAFFAFSQKQFDEQKQDGVKYASMYAGMIAPADNADQLHHDLTEYAETFAKKEMAEYGASRIIQHELANHEAQITMDISDTVDAVEIYGITYEQVKAEFPTFMKHCRDNDLFWFAA